MDLPSKLEKWAKELDAERWEGGKYDYEKVELSNLLAEAAKQLRMRSYGRFGTEMNIRVKLAGECAGRKYAVLIPAVIDSDGELTISYMGAWAAVMGMQAEMFPETVKDRSPRPAVRRKYRKST